MLQIQTVDSLDEIDAAEWDALVSSEDPFTEHAFLVALETSDSVGSRHTGWMPRHLVVRDDGRLVAAAPVYLKTDSYGEYIFDFHWAQSAISAGIPYYPKLVSAVPFTPATGKRILAARGYERLAADAILSAVAAQVADGIASSAHLLFISEAERDRAVAHDFTPRISMQYHWSNRGGWTCFDDFMAGVRAPSRKQIARERRIAASHGLDLVAKTGNELTPLEWRALYDFYVSTTERKGGFAYLTRGFFDQIVKTYAHRVVATFAEHQGRPVAGALFFWKGHSLYGRYWGAHRALDSMHFELCYYLPMQWGLERGMQRFEAGAQGEHKIKRGFVPEACHSAHTFRDARLAAAVARDLDQERAAVAHAIRELESLSPFPRGS
jgi:uncharacterized protein